MKLPMVSVVMPTYNRAALLPDVISSILNQDFDDLELIIIDDGSTDDTPNVVEKICEQDSRVRYIRLPQNRGLGFGREAGLRYAKGEYIALADSDDIWAPGRLSLQIALLSKYQHIDILFGNFLDIDHVKGTRTLGISEDKKVFQLYKTRLLEKDVYEIVSDLESAILVSNFIAAPTMVLRKKAFDLVGGFNESLAATDLEFSWRAAVLGAHFAYTTTSLIDRHIYTDNMTAQYAKAWLQRLRAVAVMRQSLQDWNLDTLFQNVHKTEIRTYRNLLRIYGEQSKPLQVAQVYFQSLKCGFSGRTFALFIVALLGPKMINAVQRVNTNGK